MKLFQKPIYVLGIAVLLILCFGKASAQAYRVPIYFEADSIASFQLASTSGQKLAYPNTKPLSCSFFLAPDCPLCKNYAPLINTLKEKYRSEIAFYLIVPGQSYSVAEVKAFSGGYLKKSVIYRDVNLNLAHYLRATVTPEVVLLESESGKAVYAGALDNWAVSLGKQRLKTTEHYLQDAIDSYLHHQVPALSYKEPVGCFINDF